MKKMILSSLALAVLTSGTLFIHQQRKVKKAELAKVLRMPRHADRMGWRYLHGTYVPFRS